MSGMQSPADPALPKTPRTPVRQQRTNEIQGDQKRRSSSRSIKRKRFDDEIVEYSLSGPQSRGEPGRAGRPRTVSQTFAPPLWQAPPLTVPTFVPNVHPPPIVDSSSPSASLLPPTHLQPPSDAANALSGLGPGDKTVPASVPVPPAGLTAPAPAALGMVSPFGGPLQTPAARATERRRNPRSTPRRPRKTARTVMSFNTKDLGRWKPRDDLSLITAIMQTNDLRTVHRGVKFSCRFTMPELQSRWSSLLYDPAISRISMKAMRNLHPETIQAVQRQTLFSAAEEEVLGTIRSTESPRLEQFQEMLDSNPSVFLAARTAKVLQNHWLLMRQYSLLPNQVVKPVGCSDQPLSFSDAEDLIADNELHGLRDDMLELELQIADRTQKREIRVLENELSRWNVLVETITGNAITPEFDGQTLAVLRGRFVRYLMRSKEITFGRYAKDYSVDVDLSFEGAAMKISRRQGTIKLRSNGDFFISNEGKRPIFINGTPIITSTKTRLAQNSVIEISGLRLVFLVNYELINAIRHESAKTITPLN